MDRLVRIRVGRDGVEVFDQHAASLATRFTAAWGIAIEAGLL
jgi:hypothetical protein